MIGRDVKESEDELLDFDDTGSPPDQEEILTFLKKLKIFFATHWRGVVLVLTPIIFLFILLSKTPIEKYQWCAYTLVVMAIYWVCECLPLAVTAFIPIIIFPLAGVMDTNTTCKCYMNDTIFMYLGSIFLAYSIEQSGLHKRIALGAVKTIGYSHYKLLFAICLVTMFISMWITNTAATVMLVPIVFALLNVFEEQKILQIYDTTPLGDKVASDMTTCYFCGVTFSATVGGIGTLVGTATNLTFKGLFQKAYPEAKEYLSFPMFSAFSVPMMLAIEMSVYFCLCLLYFGFLRPKSKLAKAAKLTPEAIAAAKNRVESDWKDLGKITYWELNVIFLFLGAILLFFCRSPQIFKGWGDQIDSYFEVKTKLYVPFDYNRFAEMSDRTKTKKQKLLVGSRKLAARDSSPAFFVCFLLMLFPYSLEIFKNCSAKYEEDMTKKPIRAVLDWRIMDKTMPYSFMFLLGGGFALSTAAKPEYTDLNGRIGDVLKHLQFLPNVLIIFLLIVFTVFLTNFASNVAIANVLVPIGMTMAKEIGYNPLWYNIAVGFSASFCFCLPVGTPGNLVAQAACNMPTGKMIKAGAGPTLATILLVWFFIYLYAPVIWPDLPTIPDWAKKKTP